MGTPGWIAPEVYSQYQMPSRYSDVWSLGCTVYELYYGKSPFSGSSEDQCRDSTVFFREENVNDLFVDG